MLESSEGRRRTRLLRYLHRRSSPFWFRGRRLTIGWSRLGRHAGMFTRAQVVALIAFLGTIRGDASATGLSETFPSYGFF